MKTQIENLWQEVRDLSLGSTQITHLNSPPTPMEFLRDFISANKPLLISNAVNHWPATTLWSSTSYLLDSLSSSSVSLHLTPSGKADSLTTLKSCSRVFGDARVEKMELGEGFGGGVDSEVKRVGDLKQNECFRSELVKDCEHNVEKMGLDEGFDEVLESEAERVGDLEEQNECFRSEYRGLNKDCEDHVSSSLVFEYAHVKKMPLDEGFGGVLGSEVERVGDLEQENECFRSDCKGLGKDGEDHVSSHLVFASAHVEKVPFDQALDVVLESKVNTRVGYLQQQNDCFRSEYKGLGKDCEDHVPWASEAMGCLPEAVNLWIGNGLSETSFHKDHYENLYVVVSGEKHFSLLPPTDVHRMYVKEYPAAQYHYSQDTGQFKLELDDPVRHVPWCSVNPYPSEAEKEKALVEFPLYFNGPKPFEVTVKAGQMLYLPSMWFHHVRQTPDERGLTVAMNYWYDMRFDIKYAYFNFLQSIHYSSPKNSPSSNVACKEGFQDEPEYREEEYSKIRKFIEN